MTRALLAAAALALAVASPASAEGPAVPYPDTLRPEWSVEPTRAGGARVVSADLVGRYHGSTRVSDPTVRRKGSADPFCADPGS